MDANALDGCKFCVKEFWKPWLLELLDIEDDARQEERAAVFDARDALSKSERDLALNRRLYAAEALLSIRAAKQAVMKAMEAIDAEKHKRLSIEKEKYNIYIPRSDADTHYKEYIAAAIKAKKMQENRFSIMEDWKKKWAIRQEYLDAEEESEEEETPVQPKTAGKATEPHTDEPPPSPSEPEEEEETNKGVVHMKPALKKKDADGPSHEKDTSDKKTHRGSKDRLPTEKREHETKITKEKGEKGPSEKKDIGEKRPSKEKGILLKKEPAETGTTSSQDKSTADKKEPGTTLTQDKGVLERKEPKSTQGQEKAATEKKDIGTPQSQEKGPMEKKETPPQTQEKGPAEKKEPAATQVKGTTDNKEPAATKPQEKPTVEKKEPAATQPQGKAATEKKEHAPPPPPPPQEKKPPAEPVSAVGVKSPEPKTETKPTQTASVKGPEKPVETTAKKT